MINGALRIRATKILKMTKELAESESVPYEVAGEAIRTAVLDTQLNEIVNAIDG